MISIEGNIVNIDKTARGRVEIGDDGLIASLGPETGRADILLNDELIFPGFIDLHVHARECADHSQDYKEDFGTASAAAINGGVVAFAEMPNNPVPPVDKASYAAKIELTKKSAVEVVLYAGIGQNTNPLNPHPGPLPKGEGEKGKVPYKLYMGPSIGNLFFHSLKEVELAVAKCRGQFISFHCEDPKILEENKSQPSHGQRRPPEAEISAVDFALKLTEKYELKAKICHCSTAEGIKKIIEAKRRGLAVTAEVSPTHLFFDSENSKNNEKFLRMNPPIRESQENRLALISALKSGDIDYLATDHAPHSIAEKEQGTSGMPHLDTYGPFVAWLMAEHNFTPQEIARVCSYNPGAFINNFTNYKYGKIAQGFVGSLTVIDSKKPVIIDKSMLKTKAGWSPFEGVKFPGSVEYTIIKGRVYKNVIPTESPAG